MTKRPFKRVQKKKRHGASFWDHEYANPENLKLSSDQSEDLEKFVRFVERESGHTHLHVGASVLDLGCGNGRNLIYLARTFGVSGIGYDISSAAISQAKAASKDLPLTYQVRSIAGDLEIPDGSQNIVLDMMSSHFLNNAERLHLREEINRVLKPGGYLFIKTFLKDGDRHTARLLAEAPGPDPDSYIHPVIGVPEYVFDEEALTEFFGAKFNLLKVYRSHKHVSKGKARKRRTVSIYAQKLLF